MNKNFKIGLAIFSVFGLSQNTYSADNDKMWETIQKQQQQINELSTKLEAAADAMDQGGGHAASKTSMGGYGELHYGNIEKTSGGVSTDRVSVDFHRFVLFFSHQYNDRIKFFSEFELEHAFIADDGTTPGEVELEQAYIDMALSDTLHMKAGLFLIPVGIINETHEPPTFYGVERNNVEKRIIPVTWWEGGIALNGEIAPGLQFDVALTSGLSDTTGNIRSGRQKVAKANGDSLAYTARLKWTGMSGVELAGTIQRQTDMAQGTLAGKTLSATLFETHAIINMGAMSLRALYAQWDIDDITGGAEEQNGFYLEPAYRINKSLGVFARYSEYDTKAGSAADTTVEQVDIGLNYWPHEDVVFKFDYQDQDDNGEKETAKGFNIGVGYQF